MKNLFPAQRRAVDFHKEKLAWGKATLDASSTGVGKTVIAATVAAEAGLPVTIVCPKIVIPHWERELADAGVSNIVTISNYEKLRMGQSVFHRVGIKAKTKTNTRKTKRFEWTGPPHSIVIWDEVHRCRGPHTLNANMLVASVEAGNYNLMLSATPCSYPPQMRAIGYALGLHNLHGVDVTRTSCKNWFSWMRSLGCRQDPWSQWVGGIPKLVREMGEKMYQTNCIRLTPDDLPSAFTQNHIIIEPLAFKELRQIRKVYNDLKLEPAVFEAMVTEGEDPDPHILTEILRARQLAELGKLPDITDMALDLNKEGLSVVVFLNFTDSVQALTRLLREALGEDEHICNIVGGQTDRAREANIDLFQRNSSKFIICNIAAGGVGVSLHDQHGGHPRASLLSPTFNFVDYTQALGRIHRNSAKSPTIQRVLVASDTIEEQVVAALEKARATFNNLHTHDKP